MSRLVQGNIHKLSESHFKLFCQLDMLLISSVIIEVFFQPRYSWFYVSDGWAEDNTCRFILSISSSFFKDKGKSKASFSIGSVLVSPRYDLSLAFEDRIPLLSQPGKFGRFIICPARIIRDSRDNFFFAGLGYWLSASRLRR